MRLPPDALVREEGALARFNWVWCNKLVALAQKRARRFNLGEAWLAGPPMPISTPAPLRK